MTQFFHLLAAMFAASAPGPLAPPSAAPRTIRRVRHGVKSHRAHFVTSGNRGHKTAHASHGGQAIAWMDRLIKQNYGARA
jgi:hypothetical protein